jgi:hypothetical protein
VEKWRYLEAAPPGTEARAQWGANGKNVGGTEPEVGWGKENTRLIVGFLGRIHEKNRAAQHCADLNFGGFNDWFLPSMDELDLMYKNLKARGLGGFRDNWYWSSSAAGDYDAWYQHFGDGRQATYNIADSRNNTYRVRAIRAF